MEREKLEGAVAKAGAAFALIGAVLLIPAVRRRIAAFASDKIEELGSLDGSAIAAEAGSAVAKAALLEGGKAAALKAKEQLLR
jgi:hypothetical protein